MTGCAPASVRDVDAVDHDELRLRGWRGGLIRPHRAMVRLHPTVGDAIASAAMLIGVTLIWMRSIPLVTAMWTRIFRWWVARLGLNAPVVITPQSWGSHIHFAIPFISLPAGAITPGTWLSTALLTAIALAVSFYLGEEMAPAAYLIRALVIIQTTALVYFAFFAARFPHDLPSYTVGMLVFGVILISMVPAVLAFTYYVFDFAWWKKLSLTLGAMAYLALFMPLQYVLHVWILHHSILFMPLLYFAFGPFLDVLIFVCIYSWGMSWKARQEA
jgi:hypothetical protein